MSDDLVKRLRSIDDDQICTGCYTIVEAADEAADRIEKLEAALRVYAEEDHWSGDTFEPIMFLEGECKCCYEHFSDRGEIARKALEGKNAPQEPI
jgi:hypothetical protein